MPEQNIILENEEARIICSNSNLALQILESKFFELSFNMRGNTLRVQGSNENIEKFNSVFNPFKTYLTSHSDDLTEEKITQVLRSYENPCNKLSLPADNVILYGNNGREIKARSSSQSQMYDAVNKNDLIFAVGPAGCGKTYFAIALAVKALKDKRVKRIILSRPAVEAGEKLGFLPGDMKEKIDPYLQPLYDALNDMMESIKLKKLMDDNVIQIAPLAFLRGRTLNESFIILDEAQNTTVQQIKMFITRMGVGSKMIINGDITQIDLPKNCDSGLIVSLKVLKNIKQISQIFFKKEDIVRHRLVQIVVNAFDKFSN